MRLHRVDGVSRLLDSYIPSSPIDLYDDRLNNGDISRKVAQAASCLNEKLFSRTLNLVRKAIDENKGSSSKKSVVAATYPALTRSHGISMLQQMVAWMEETERAAVLTDNIPKNHGVDGPLVKCAIFYWVCKQLKVCTSHFQFYPKTTILRKWHDLGLVSTSRPCPFDRNVQPATKDFRRLPQGLIKELWISSEEDYIYTQ